MNASLAGYNLLLLADKRHPRGRGLAEGLVSLGANLFAAHDAAEAKALQKRLDLDLVLADSAFLEGVGEDVVLDHGPFQGKPAPMLFAFGSLGVGSLKKFKARGGLRIFPADVSAQALAEGVLPFLFNPKEHFRKLMQVEAARQISLVLQDGAGQWALDVHEVRDDGLCAAPEAGTTGETGVLTILFPDENGQQVQRFSVRLERSQEGTPQLRLKILHKDRDRWQGFLGALETRQAEITDFLIASSGR